MIDTIIVYAKSIEIENTVLGEPIFYTAFHTINIIACCWIIFNLVVGKNRMCIFITGIHSARL